MPFFWGYFWLFNENSLTLQHLYNWDSHAMCSHNNYILSQFMKRMNLRQWLLAFACAIALHTQAANPYLPLWEHIPDGEPYVFEDPDMPGHYRVYIYGSHDIIRTGYCGRDQVVWSADVNNLNDWRFDGVILQVPYDASGKPVNPDGQADVLFAPDIAVVKNNDGKKTYYLYPNNQGGGRNGMVAMSDRPNGPFRVCNWSKTAPNKTDGVLAFDPAVFVDDDGRVYGYWGFGRSNGAELDPLTMATVKPGTEIVQDMVSGWKQEGVFRFFEASSIRKIKDKYVFIYSRMSQDGDFGLPTSNYTLAYAYSDHPLGPWTYGGTIIDGRARGKNAQGQVIATATPDGNTHGSIAEINGQWYVFYHRQTGTDEYARQAMVAPIQVKVTEGKGGKVVISEGEYTSEGFETNGLVPEEWHAAGIACHYTGPKPATHDWPNNTFSGSYIDNSENCLVVNNTNGSIVGYKYFNFGNENAANTNHAGKVTNTNKTNKRMSQLVMQLIPQGIDGVIHIFVDSPYASKKNKELGTITLRADMPKTSTEISASLPQLTKLKGKHALYFTFTSDTSTASLCSLEKFRFQ